MNDEKLKEQGLLVPVIICSRLAFVSFMVIAAAAFDAIFNAILWLGTTRNVVKRFAEDVSAVARAASPDLEVAAADHLPTGFATPVIQSSDHNEGTEQNAIPTSSNVVAVEKPFENPFLVTPNYHASRIAAQARVNEAFRRAWDMSHVVNEPVRLFAEHVLFQIERAALHSYELVWPGSLFLRNALHFF